MIDSRFRRVQVQLIFLVVAFVFCQVIGMMCALPDMTMAEETATLVRASEVCPMDETTMCPPSVTSSPERQAKHRPSAEFEQGPSLLPLGDAPRVVSIFAQWSWSNACSIDPISIASSSVLRI